MIVATALLLPASPSGAGGTGVNADKSKIATLEAKINAQGSAAERLVDRYNEVQGDLASIDHEIATSNSALSHDHRAEADATVQLRHWAVDAYVTALSGSAGLSGVMDATDASELPDQQVYLGSTTGKLNDAVATLQLDQVKTAATENALKGEEAETAATLAQPPPHATLPKRRSVPTKPL